MIQIYNKPCTIPSCCGTMYFSEAEDFNAGEEPEWSYSHYWCCDTCKEIVYDCDDNFEWPEGY